MTRAKNYAAAWDALESAAGHSRLLEIVALGATSREIALALAALSDPLAPLVAEVVRWDDSVAAASPARDSALRELARCGDEDAFDELYG